MNLIENVDDDGVEDGWDESEPAIRIKDAIEALNVEHAVSLDISLMM